MSYLAPTSPVVGSEPAIFDAELFPHRSITPVGLRVFDACLWAVTIALSFILAARNWWVALPFVLGDAVFLSIAMHLCFAGRASSEQIRVDRHGVSVSQFDRRRRLVRDHRLPLYGLTVERVNDPDYGLRALRLSLRGQGVEIARHLAPTERAAFADRFEDELRAAGLVLWRREKDLPPLLAG